MKKNNPTPTIHPLEEHLNEAEEQGVIVLDEIRGIPSAGEPYVSPHLVIVLCHQGYSIGEYDTKPIEFRAKDFSVIYPNHPIQAIDTSDDYLATMIVISSDFYKQLQLGQVYSNSFIYHRQALFHLDDLQYQCLNNTITLLKTVNCLDLEKRKEIVIDVLELLSKLADNFWWKNRSEATSNSKSDDLSNKSLFNQFYNLLTKHYKESREVRFYAQKLYLSPKYFGSVIKKETGVTVGHCISHYISIQAKALLRHRTDLNIQQVGHMIGFDDATAFSRYFKAYVGISPKEYREQVLDYY